MPLNDIFFVALLIIVCAASVYTNKLTLRAAIAACIVAVCIYTGTGFTGIILLGSFFTLGVVATSWKKKEKDVFPDELKGRNAKQVLANGSVAALCGIASWQMPEYENIFLIMMACSLSSATADTVSSELGVIYGRKFYNILNFRKDIKGENGVISIEGTFLGIAGSLVIAVIHFLMGQQFQWSAFIIIIIAGTIGNIADSLLGATLERNNIIGNNAVNFLNTLIAALIGGLMI